MRGTTLILGSLEAPKATLELAVLNHATGD